MVVCSKIMPTWRTGSQVHENWHFQLVEVPVFFFFELWSPRYILRFITGMAVKDPTAGLLLSSKRFAGIDLNKIKFTGYTFRLK